jgi:hypothetical protein
MAKMSDIAQPQESYMPTRNALIRFILVTLLFMTASRHAFGMTSSDLVQRCRGVKMQYMSDGEMADLYFCEGYVLGITDTELMHQMEVDKTTLKPLHKKFVCMDDSIPVTELVLVYLKYMDDHPAMLHTDAEVTVWNAINAAYHCPK